LSASFEQHQILYQDTGCLQLCTAQNLINHISTVISQPQVTVLMWFLVLLFRGPTKQENKHNPCFRQCEDQDHAKIPQTYRMV